MGKKAIFVMDIQNDFIGDHARMPVAKHHIQPMLESIHLLFDNINQADCEVVYIANEFERKDVIANFFRNFAAMKGQHGSKLDERLRIINDNYFSKSKASAFSNPNLVSFLQKQEIDRIFIAGLFTEECVFHTAIAAKKRGFHVTILEDAVASATDLKREKALRKLKQHGISTIHSRFFMEV